MQNYNALLKKGFLEDPSVFEGANKFELDEDFTNKRIRDSLAFAFQGADDNVKAGLRKAIDDWQKDSNAKALKKLGKIQDDAKEEYVSCVKQPLMKVFESRNSMMTFFQGYEIRYYEGGDAKQKFLDSANKIALRQMPDTSNLKDDRAVVVSAIDPRTNLGSCMYAVETKQELVFTKWCSSDPNHLHFRLCLALILYHHYETKRIVRIAQTMDDIDFTNLEFLLVDNFWKFEGYVKRLLYGNVLPWVLEMVK